MSKYKFTQEEEELLKVAKLNQEKSMKLKCEMEKLQESWNNNNKFEEEFLSKIESKLGISHNEQNVKKEIFKRETEYITPLEWDEIVHEAEQKYSKNIDFEDLLTKEEFLIAYQHIDEINKEFEKKTGLNKNLNP